ncbi:MAG: beta-glucosidase [Verrucomicrobia bacterium]|nr:beta-glucosidase [Verrucomicrobiota bacterium]
MRHRKQHLSFWAFLIVVAVVLTARSETLEPVTELQSIRALSRSGRVDILWDQGEALFFEIERQGPGEKAFRRINKLLWTTNVYGDFLGNTTGPYAYRVRAILVSKDGKKRVSAWSPVVEASPREIVLKELVTEVQEASFRYFYNWRHPVSGLAREKTPPRSARAAGDIRPRYVGQVRDVRRLCTTGATGMGMFNLVVGVERGFITRDEGIAWALQMLRFLDTKARKYHGAFSHWLFGDTGKTRHFAGPQDNGADTVETAFLASGFIVLREYFTGDSVEEREIRKLADSLWKGIEWDWFTRGKQGGPIYWHWSPDYGWEKNHPVRGFNEAAILYVLALASPTHPIHRDSYHKAWRHARYGVDRTEFGIPMTLGQGIGPPLFWTHYSYMGLDPRQIHYRGESYFDHFRKFCQVQIKYMDSKADTFKGYGSLLWGLTSSANPNGYLGHRPGKRDDGTIAPTAALSSIPYVPRESLVCLKELYLEHGTELWKDYGFTDAFNLTEDWVAPVLLGIDAGPIAPMIENARTKLCWNLFMNAPEIQAVLPELASPERE